MGYATGEALSADAAFAYHRDQADVLAGLDVDLLYAPTFPAFSELSGVARAMAQTGRPYALAPMLQANGTMLDGGATRSEQTERGFDLAFEGAAVSVRGYSDAVLRIRSAPLENVQEK